MAGSKTSVLELGLELVQNYKWSVLELQFLSSRTAVLELAICTSSSRTSS